ncbi:transposase [Arthrobacter alpinus]|uniref:transposase n=1 Tax=Arthrobacter alpinus TaxID=656366 RepID=UPI001648D42B
MAPVNRCWLWFITLLTGRLTTAKVEAINIRIKNFKRTAFGSRNPTNYQPLNLLRISDAQRCQEFI